MNLKTKAWINAARPRTLPLSISGILVGSAYAYGDLAFAKAELEQSLLHLIDFKSDFNWWIPVLALLTTLGFQILSNFANDYGDGVKGTDNQDRIGPMRAIQSGMIQPAQMKAAIVITGICTFILAIALIYVSLGAEKILVSLLFIGLGIAAIWAAIKYTIGDNAYGYRGLGDVFVFIFFGPVSILGIYYLITLQLNHWLWLPSLTIGLLSTAVLNLNNMRDIKSDKTAGKNTLPVKIGIDNAKILHYTVLFIAMASLIIYLIHYSSQWSHSLLLLPVVAFIPLLLHLRRVYLNDSPALLDPELKVVALSTFFVAILGIISIAITLLYL
jgi:1,4-dihydroxy-2-naphthoate octaprenyltransferase